MLEAPEQDYAPESERPRRGSGGLGRRVRREFSEDFADDFDGFDEESSDAPMPRRRNGVKVRFRWGIPRTKWGRIAAGVSLLGLIGFGVATVLTARKMVLHDERFVIPSSSAISIEGNQHLTQSQLLSIFGGDVERNIFTVSLEDRRAELEALPWVEHATVMRLLPNHLRISIVERTPVAFVRQGNHIGLVDASGILLDMPPDEQVTEKYSFPVVTGISAQDPLSTRAARMKIFRGFTTDLNSGGEKISEQLSEVDLSDPEDVKALIPDHHVEVLVHFGETDFLDRYRKFREHLPEWLTQYPKLSSVDMRYDRQAVLEMQPGSAVPLAGQAADDSAGAKQPSAAADAATARPATTSKAGSTTAASGVRPVVRGRHQAGHPSAVKRNGAKTRSAAKRTAAVSKKPHATVVHP